MEDPVADMPNTESPRRISPCARDTASIPVPVRLGKHLRMGDITVNCLVRRREWATFMVGTMGKSWRGEDERGFS